MSTFYFKPRPPHHLADMHDTISFVTISPVYNYYALVDFHHQG